MSTNTSNKNSTSSRLPAVNAQNVLTNAADIILSRGRARGDFVNSRGGVCALGAIALGAGASSPSGTPSGPRQRASYQAARNALAENLGDASDPFGAITTWSDSGHMSAKRIATRLLTVANNL